MFDNALDRAVKDIPHLNFAPFPSVSIICFVFFFFFPFSAGRILKGLLNSAITVAEKDAPDSKPIRVVKPT